MKTGVKLFGPGLDSINLTIDYHAKRRYYCKCWLENEKI